MADSRGGSRLCGVQQGPRQQITDVLRGDLPITQPVAASAPHNAALGITSRDQRVGPWSPLIPVEVGALLPAGDSPGQDCIGNVNRGVVGPPGVTAQVSLSLAGAGSPSLPEPSCPAGGRSTEFAATQATGQTPSRSGERGCGRTSQRIQSP